MKIAVINGQPQNKTTNTNIMTSAFLKGAQQAGAETATIFFAKNSSKTTEPCHSYWFHHPEQCMTKHDMAEALVLGTGTNVIVLTTPVYFENISGMLTIFMDKLIKTNCSRSLEDNVREDMTTTDPKVLLPKLMILSSWGSPERSEIQLISLWIKRIALKMHTEVIGEIYARQGRFLNEPTGHLRPAVMRYLALLEKAGGEIATNMELSLATKNLLEQNDMPEKFFKTANPEDPHHYNSPYFCH